ncbi:MAG: VWA domain-containing protein [Victivallales bacterium]|nr:VWA domain-containing protein [Victivallales bacterium]
MWIVLFILAALATIAIEFWGMLQNYRRQACYTVALTRIVMLLAALLFLKPPHRTIRTPQYDKLKIAAAADVSASMNVKNGNTSRRQQVEDLLNDAQVQSFLSRLGRMDYYQFSDTAIPLLPDTAKSYRLAEAPGNTRLGNVLADFLKQSHQGTPLSAVLLFTDGRSNDGMNPLDVAKQFAAEKIPISVIGVSGDENASDVRIKATSSNIKATRNQSFELTADVLRTGKGTPEPVTVELVSDGQVVARTSVLPDNTQPTSVHFNAQLPIAGFHTFMFRLIPPPGDSRVDNDIDFVSVDVTEPPIFRILYLSYGLDWEWRFFNLNCSQNRQLAVSAIIQTGKDRFYSLENDGSPEGKAKENNDVKAFPSTTDSYKDYDLIIANAELFLHLDEQQRKAIRSFAEYKGGGLVIRGYNDEIPQDIQELIPAKSIRRMTARTQLKLAVLTDLVYKRDTAKALQPPQGLWLPVPTEVDIIEEPRRSMRELIRINATNGKAVAAVHAYGAGRVAFIGLNETWRWALQGTPYDIAYMALWNHLVVWLAETARPIIRIADNGSHVTSGEPHSFEAEILGNDFRPAADAKVAARFIAPDGVATSVAMLPSLDDIGRYSAEFIPPKPGEYRLEVTTDSPSGTIQRQGAFLACLNSRETEDTSANLPLLQDIARITGGKFFLPEDYLDEFANIPLSSNVPMAESTHPILPPWFLFVIFVIAASGSWWTRRRLGMK